MKNIAGNPDCDRYIRDELTRCGIDIVEAPIDHPEVKSTLRGVLRVGDSEFRFERYWYYWVARGPVPLSVARKLYADPVGCTDIRVSGHCACPPPEEWTTHYAQSGKKLVKPFSTSEISYANSYLESGWLDQFEFSDDPASDAHASFVECYHIDSELGLYLFVQAILERDVRRAERERCKEACRTVAEEIDDIAQEFGAHACEDAIEALGDE